jgi:putative sterol carrier protein
MDVITRDAADKAAAAEWTSRQGAAAGLERISGRLRLEVAGALAGVLHVENGAVEIAPDGDAPALCAVDTQSTLFGILGGEMHPFVAFLQGRLRIEGDRALALRILFGLQAGSPWSGLAPKR